MSKRRKAAPGGTFLSDEELSKLEHMIFNYQDLSGILAGRDEYEPIGALLRVLNNRMIDFVNRLNDKQI